MSVELTERGIGTELVQLETSKILVQELNDEINRQEELWTTRDLDWNQLTGQQDVIKLEVVEQQNFFKGHMPRMIDKAIQEFPNVSVMVYEGKGIPGLELIDQASNFTLTVDVEVFVKGKSPLETDARIHRSTEAVHQVLTRNENLNGTSLGWNGDPVIRITDTVPRKANTSHGEDWFLKGCRIRYNMNRRSKLPETV